MKHLCLLLLIVLLSACYARVPDKTGKEGEPIPHFTMLFLDSTTYYNTEHIASGKPVIFIYFGTHCPYSRAQTHDIVESMNKMKNVDFYFVSAAPMNEIRTFVKEYGLDKYPNIKVGHDYTKFFSDYYEVPGVPFIAVFDKSGKLGVAFDGQVSAKQLRNCVQG